MLIDEENNTAFAINIAVTLTHNRPITVEEKIKKYENLALEVKVSGILTTYLSGCCVATATQQPDASAYTGI